MNLIACADKSWGIGKNGSLLCHIPDDMKFFKKTTINKTVIMGRKTFLSLPGAMPLADRENIVLTRDTSFNRDGVYVCRSIDELLKKTKNYPPGSLYVIGGGEIYKALLPYCERAYITKVNAVFDADTYLIDLDKAPLWRLTECSDSFFHNGTEYRFTVYENIKEALEQKSDK